MRRSISLAAALTAGVLLTGCSSGTQHDAISHDTATAAVDSSSNPAPKASVRLLWTHTDKGMGTTAVWYVARVSNPGASPASVSLDARALDKSGTIIGSDTETLPAVPARGSFDYFGNLGDSVTQLTGTPAKVTVSPSDNAMYAGTSATPLATSELKLSKGTTDDGIVDTPYSYNLTVKVTNSTKKPVNGYVIRQVILYDKAGKIVGGDTGSSDNVPSTLAPGASYREQWADIPAVRPAVRAVYTVWAG
ncbi:hypothetical protein [Streptomyces sp. MUM 16J]|uniref:hypothetical protein n=1 Tax=Streptomyces sp. MUM 16J TaxID=2791988 RepID=UPI001F049E4E|nr:hypothetical protein [Streptomyces sp. MUM 16J]MCH0557996.1 hypothetical protein [Streptomyces sp. MUM 16J]